MLLLKAAKTTVTIWSMTKASSLLAWLLPHLAWALPGGMLARTSDIGELRRITRRRHSCLLVTDPPNSRDRRSSVGRSQSAIQTTAVPSRRSVGGPSATIHHDEQPDEGQEQIKLIEVKATRTNREVTVGDRITVSFTVENVAEAPSSDWLVRGSRDGRHPMSCISGSKPLISVGLSPAWRSCHRG
jgi:hypothetical protein